MHLPVPYPDAARLQHHMAFWRREPVERPLTGVYLGGYLSNDIYAVAQEGDWLTPEQLAPEPFLDLFYQDAADLSALDQDLIYPVQPLSSVPWLEGMLGCPIQVQAQSVWAGPVLGADEPLSGFEPVWQEAWAQAAEHSLDTFAAYFAPIGIPVAGPFLRGPADVLAALIGADRLCCEVLDEPDQVRRLAGCCAAAWARATRRMLARVPAWQGGYVVGARWIYAPGPCTYASEDITCIFSEKVYREVFLPSDRWLTEQVPYGFMHRHSPSLHHLEDLLVLPAGWAVEVTMDPTGPHLSEILPVFKRIQAAGRPLIVFGLTDPEEISRLVSELDPRGLCLTLQAGTPEQARVLVSAARLEKA